MGFERRQIRRAIVGQDLLVEKPEDSPTGLHQQPARDAVWRRLVAEPPAIGAYDQHPCRQVGVEIPAIRLRHGQRDEAVATDRRHANGPGQSQRVASGALRTDVEQPITEAAQTREMFDDQRPVGAETASGQNDGTGLERVVSDGDTHDGVTRVSRRSTRRPARCRCPVRDTCGRAGRSAPGRSPPARGCGGPARARPS